ncbi:MAG: alanine racemase [Acidobacteriaceae bacterium]|jgi:alanine racemase
MSTEFPSRYNQPVSAQAISKRSLTRPTWAEVSLENLRTNFRSIQQHVGNTVKICAVVKADAYGHGAVECSRALESEGAKWLGVTSLDEAVPLRDASLASRILLMTGFWRGEQEDVVRLGLTPTVWEVSQIELLEEAAAKFAVRGQSIHLKIDTGMGRLGASLEELPNICAALKSCEHLVLEGISTHLASSEVLDSESAQQQLRRFEEAQQIVRREGMNPPLIHIANSSAIISRPETRKQMVRPGIALYGYHLPFEKSGGQIEAHCSLALKPVLTWKTQILSVKAVKAHQALGYGGIFTTSRPSKIAILPVGYADGLNRRLSSRANVIVKGIYAPIRGRISMDLTLIDVTDIPGVAVGDEAILLGSQGSLNVDAQRHAILADTIPYEILCNISKRVPRKYTD